MLLVPSLILVVMMWLPPQSWTLWLARFVALETSLVASGLGLAALLCGRGHFTIQGLAFGSLMAGLVPLLSALPVYARERQRFSLLAWCTGGATPSVAIDRDIELAPGLRADLYRAPGNGPHPFVMVVHGGSWRSGDKGVADRESRAFAAAGTTVIDVQYRLAPQHPFPAAVEDVRLLLRAVRARADSLQIDPDRAALLGRSAGAQIALLAAHSAGEVVAAHPDNIVVRAVISLYGPTDLAWSHSHPFLPDVVDGTAALEQYLGGSPEQNPDAYRRATPMTWAAHATAATLILHGTAERCVRVANAERLRDALSSAGKSVKLVLVPFAEHGFDVRPGGIGAQLSRGLILDFLRTSLAR